MHGAEVTWVWERRWAHVEDAQGVEVVHAARNVHQAQDARLLRAMVKHITNMHKTRSCG